MPNCSPLGPEADLTFPTPNDHGRLVHVDTDMNVHSDEGSVGASVHSQRVAGVDDLAVGEMKLVSVDDHRIALARTVDGYCAVDNACPHQGYGLVTGHFDGETITCQWHNWKYDVRDGRCVQGEEDVASHRVEIVTEANGPGREPGVYVEVRSAPVVEQVEALWPSLQRGIATQAPGHIARDTARLLTLGVTPEAIVAEVVANNLRRTEWGPGHELAVLADALTLASTRTGLNRTLPLVQGLTGLAEETHHQREYRQPSEPWADVDHSGEAFVAAIEAEDHPQARARIAALVSDETVGDHDTRVARAREWFVAAVSAHHLGYGHGAIYVQKAFELIERVPAVLAIVVEELVVTTIYATREDTLPYLRPTAADVAAADVAELAAAGAHPVPADERDALVDVLFDATTAEVPALVVYGLRYGVDAMLDVISLTASRRMLAYDLDVEVDGGDPFGWLDLTHALTYANAARALFAASPNADGARLALWTGWLVFDAGRHHRRAPHRADLATGDPAVVAASPTALRAAVLHRDVERAVAIAGALPPNETAQTLEDLSLEDLGGSTIVVAHLIKVAVTARRESDHTGSLLPLLAATRFMAAPRIERFVHREVRDAVAFIGTGRPPRR